MQRALAFRMRYELSINRCAVQWERYSLSRDVRTSMRETKSCELFNYRPIDAEKCEFIKAVMLDLIKSYNFISLL